MEQQSCLPKILRILIARGWETEKAKTIVATLEHEGFQSDFDFQNLKTLDRMEPLKIPLNAKLIILDMYHPQTNTPNKSLEQSPSILNCC
jgi:hypothetical protein